MPENQSVNEQKPSFFASLVDKVKSAFVKTTDVAGQTIQSGVNVVGSVATTAVNTWVNMAQWVGNAVQNNQWWNVLENIVWATKDIASNTVNVAVNSGSELVETGKETVSGVVDAWKDAVQTVSEKVGEVKDKVVDTVAEFKWSESVDVKEGEVQAPVVETPVETPVIQPSVVEAVAEVPMVETPAVENVTAEIPAVEIIPDTSIITETLVN